MKPQDFVFIAILVILLVLRKPKIIIGAGLLCLALSIPLFSFWIFFTAQRLVYYFAAFIFSALVLSLLQSQKK